jgi:hypothetical protein
MIMLSSLKKQVMAYILIFSFSNVVHATLDEEDKNQLPPAQTRWISDNSQYDLQNIKSGMLYLGAGTALGFDYLMLLYNIYMKSEASVEVCSDMITAHQYFYEQKGNNTQSLDESFSSAQYYMMADTSGAFYECSKEFFKGAYKIADMAAGNFVVESQAIPFQKYKNSLQLEEIKNFNRLYFAFCLGAIGASKVITGLTNAIERGVYNLYNRLRQR